MGRFERFGQYDYLVRWRSPCAGLASKALLVVTLVVNVMLIAGTYKLSGITVGTRLVSLDPPVAGMYQLVMMILSVFRNDISAVAVLQFVRRTAFTRARQLRL